MSKSKDAKRLEALLRRAGPGFKRRYLAMIERAKKRWSLQTLARLIEHGRLEDALSIFDKTATALHGYASEVFIAAADGAAKSIQSATGDIFIEFDRVNERAVSAMRQNNLERVQNFSSHQRRATRSAILDGIQRGANPREQARAFRNSIGLTERQDAAVRNFGRMLREGDAGVLSRKLRDRRYDGMIERAIEGKKPLTRKQIRTMVKRYRERYIKYRAEVIARTEALRSVHQGSEAMFEQAFDEGVLDPKNVVRTWNTASDERVRGSHSTMNGQPRGVGMPFAAGAGNPIMFPGDSSALAEEVIQCRCVVSIRIKTKKERGVA